MEDYLNLHVYDRVGNPQEDNHAERYDNTSGKNKTVMQLENNFAFLTVSCCMFLSYQ